MSNKLKERDIKYCVYYFFDNIISTQNVDLNKINKHEK